MVLPMLVWRRYKWFTRFIVLGPAGKAVSLCWRQGRAMSGEAVETTSFAYDWMFIAVAITTAILLFRAGWGPNPTSHASGED